jgi:hypothetical protein
MLDNVRTLFAPTASPAEAARAALRAKIAARPQVAAALKEASAAVARVRQVIDEARRAHADAQRAESADEAATKAWAAAGAPSESAPNDAPLVAAQHAAALAVSRAKGARLALPELLAAEDHKRNLLASHDLETRGAAAQVLVDEIVAPVVARGMEARADYVAAVQLCEAMLELTAHYGDAHPFHGFSDPHERVDAMLRELAVPEAASDPAMRELLDRVASFARALCTDVEAKWPE